MFDVVLCSGAFFSSFVDIIHASEVKIIICPIGGSSKHQSWY